MSGGEGTVFKMAAGNIVFYDNMDEMTGYNAKLTFFGFKLITLTPKLVKYGVKIPLKVSWRVWAFVSRLKLYM